MRVGRTPTLADTGLNGPIQVLCGQGNIGPQGGNKILRLGLLGPII